MLQQVLVKLSAIGIEAEMILLVSMLPYTLNYKYKVVLCREDPDPELCEEGSGSALSEEDHTNSGTDEVSGSTNKSYLLQPASSRALETIARLTASSC